MDEQHLHDRRWFSLAVLAGCVLVITLDNTILNVAIPSLVHDLGASLSQLQWIIDGYTLVFASLLLTAGALGDRFGRKGWMQIGLLIFGMSSLMASLSTTPMQLTLARATMGIGGALIMPATLSLMTNIFRDPKERGRAIGIWAAVAGASGALGPIAGGLLIKYFSWHAVFLVNLPIVVVLVVAARFLLPSSKAADAPRLDPMGAVLSIVGFMCVLWAIIESPSMGWSSPKVITALSVGFVVLAAFIGWELRSDHPMLDIRFFRDRRFSAANLAITLVYFAMFGQMFVMSQYMQVILGFTPLGAGIRMVPMSLVMMFAAPLAPRLVERVGTKLVVGCGLLIASLGVFIVSTVPTADGYPRLLMGVVVLALGMACVMAPATESIMGSLPPSKAGVGSAMNDTTRQMGGALGVAILGSVLASIYQPNVESQLSALGLPEPMLKAAVDSVGGAVQGVVPQLATTNPALAEQVKQIAINEYVAGQHVAMRVGALVILIAAFVVFKWLPARATDAREAHSGTLDAFASLTYAEAEGVVEHDEAEIQGLIDADADSRYDDLELEAGADPVGGGNPSTER